MTKWTRIPGSIGKARYKAMAPSACADRAKSLSAHPFYVNGNSAVLPETVPTGRKVADFSHIRRHRFSCFVVERMVGFPLLPKVLIMPSEDDFRPELGRLGDRGSSARSRKLSPRTRDTTESEREDSFSPAQEILGELPVEPICVRIPVAVKLTGISRSTLYELMGAGEIETVKVGRSTFIRYASLKRLFDRE